MDFETSKVEALSGVTTATGAGGGTIGYVDPEVFFERAPPSTASDMYAFGVLMSEVLAGSRFTRAAEVARSQVRISDRDISQ